MAKNGHPTTIARRPAQIGPSIPCGLQRKHLGGQRAGSLRSPGQEYMRAIFCFDCFAETASAKLCTKPLILHDIDAWQCRDSNPSPYFACEIKIHQKCLPGSIEPDGVSNDLRSGWRRENKIVTAILLRTDQSSTVAATMPSWESLRFSQRRFCSNACPALPFLRRLRR
jgi:hypothetical protein